MSSSKMSQNFGTSLEASLSVKITNADAAPDRPSSRGVESFMDLNVQTHLC